MPQIIHEALGGEMIEYKELFVLACNVITFGPLIDKIYILVLRTDNQGVWKNIIKHCFKNCWTSLGLCRYLFIYSFYNNINFRAKKVVQIENEHADAFSKLRISQFKTLISKECKDKYDIFNPRYDILLNAHHYFDLILK